MYFGWKPYVPVAQRRSEAERKVAQLRKKGQPIAPVMIEGRTIAASFWGKSWCTNLERYSDYASRLPRGRSYVRNGSVIDLQIAGGEVTALVQGSDLYKIRIAIAPVKPNVWTSICRDCSGTVSSLVELLQGRISKNVMDRVCRGGDGLFPAPKDIKLSCSCPDWASMCKHVAAALYGVGARLDSKPELLFVLRGVDSTDLLSAGPQTLTDAPPATGNVLDDGDVAALFGLEMADPGGAAAISTVKAGPAPAPLAAGMPARRRRSPAAQTSARTGKAPPAKEPRGKGKVSAAGTASPPAVAKDKTKTAAVSVKPVKKADKKGPPLKAAPARRKARTGPSAAVHVAR